MSKGPSKGPKMLAAFPRYLRRASEVGVTVAEKRRAWGAIFDSADGHSGGSCVIWGTDDECRRAIRALNAWAEVIDFKPFDGDADALHASKLIARIARRGTFACLVDRHVRVAVRSGKVRRKFR